MLLFEYLRHFFYKKNQLQAIFQDETGRILIKRMNYKNNQFTLKRRGQDPELYNVNPDFAKHNIKNGLPVAFYNLHNPDPIKWEFEFNEEWDSRGAEKIIKSKVIFDLFSDQMSFTTTLLLILLIVTLVLVVFLILLNTNVIHLGTPVNATVTR